MASKLKTFILTEHRTQDSWIRSEAFKFKQYVSYRIGEIRENSIINEWRWVPTKENVADEATKWTRIPQFDNHNRWYTGPKFLLYPKNQWPKENKNDISEITDLEMRPAFVAVTVMYDLNTSLPYIDRFSDYLKLIRTTAWLLRFFNNCMSKVKPNYSNLNKLYLTKDELEKSETLWLRFSQWLSFRDEIIILQNKKTIPKNSKLYKLSPYLCSDGIIRLGGRISHSTILNNQTKFPVILDSKQTFTKLLIKFYHEQFNHQGQETVINEIKQKYYILKIRSAVKYTSNNCQVCKIFRTNPEIPKMGSLPEERITGRQRPFSFTGIDCICWPKTRKTIRRTVHMFNCSSHSFGDSYIFINRFSYNGN